MVHSDFPGHAGGKPRSGAPANQPGRLASFGRNLNSAEEGRPLKAGLSHNGPVQVVSRGA
jgi:hypothetical protein